MDSTPTFCRFAISFLICSKVTFVSGTFFDVIRDPSTGNDASVNLTCISEDDGAALVWNYYNNVKETGNGLDVSTDFEPKKPAPRSPKDCGLWNSTQCFGRWDFSEDWKLVDSAIRPMAPVFDYRWEGFREISFDSINSKKAHEPQYVKQLTNCGTVFFSARVLTDLHIFLCQFEDPEEGPCFRVVLGSWSKNQSEILNCVSGKLEDELCEDVAKVEHENAILKGYEWRTFRLEWSAEENTIKVFQNTDRFPFLEGHIDKWHDMSHLSVGKDTESRIRFHFYEYFLTTRKNAVLSTTEFLQPDNHFCIELMVGLCTDCRLDVSLMNSGDDIPMGSIYGPGNEGHDELMRWRSVRINTTLLDSKLIKLKIVTEMIEGGVEGRWAIDHFRTCEPVGGLRKSTIPIHRIRMTSTTSFWPEVKCQKLSYAGSELVGSPLINILPGRGEPVGRVKSDDEGVAMNMDQGPQASGDDQHLIRRRDTAAENADDAEYMEHQETGSKNSRRSLSIHKRNSRADLRDQPEEVKLQIYEADREKQTVSVRLTPLRLVLDGVDSYFVQIVIDGKVESYKNRFEVTDDPVCKLWDDALCFQNLDVKNIKGWDVPSTRIRVSGQKNDLKVPGKQWECGLQLDVLNKDPSLPVSLTITFPNPGIVKFKWKHPWLPYTKIERFQIRITRIETSLIESEKVVNVTADHPGVPEQKEYERELELYPSSQYHVEVLAVNQHDFGTPAKYDFTTPSRIDFESGEISVPGYNETWIEFKVPAVTDATINTWVTVTVEGSLKCIKNDSSESPSTKQTNIKESSVFVVYKVKKEPHRDFKISENGIRDSEFTCALRPGYTYVIKAEAKDNVTNVSAGPIESIEITLPSGNGEDAPLSMGNKSNLGWLVIIPIVAIVAVLLFIFHRKRRKSLVGTSQEEFSPIQKPKHSNSVGRSSPPANLTKNKISIESERSAPDVVPKSPYSFPVPIDQFEEHTKDALASGLLQAQYEMISKYPRKPHEYGSLPENVTKNRYQDLTAYDHSRVKLKKISGDDHSDYINANYIKGYNKAKAYIATQGPKPNTVEDFWRMIWQEKVTVICMLANVKEGRKIKCEKYWPDVDAEAAVFGDIKVLNTTHEVFADYTIRRFHVNVNKETRTITHLHYTGWPDHGVPMYTQSLVSYIQKLREMKSDGGGPVVVHCSAGVGRTGTIILCDVCLSQAEEKKFVDPLGTTVQMRDDRSNMVDSKQQYLLAHLTIVESRISEQTQVPCTAALPKMISELRKRLESDIKILDEIVWQERALHEIAEPRRPSEDGGADNSDGESFAAGAGSNCINAVSVAGVKMKEQYLAARLPTASTLSDFWELIAEYRIELVVILQSPDPENPKYCDIVSSESTFFPAPDIKVETKADPVMELHYSVKKLSLTVGSEETEKPQPVTVLNCNDWECRKNGKPPKPGALVSLWIASEKISRKESPTLVICRDGVTGCGLYLALSFLLERMAVETECDVISAVRAVRRSQPDFVKSIDQFQYLYDAATNYHESFKTYGNMA